MDIKNTVVNSNENDIFLGSAYYSNGVDRDKSYRVKYRKLVNDLIEKYWNSPFKAMPKSRQYTFVELRLVTEFDIAERFYNPDPHPAYREIRMSNLRMIADALEINPILLYNDNTLPFYLIP